MRNNSKLNHHSTSSLILLSFLIIIILFLQLDIVLSTGDPVLDEWQDFSQNKTLKKQLIEWLKCKAKAKMTGNECEEQLNVKTPAYFGKLGIFITLKKGKNVRGCYGAFSHASTDFAAVLSDYLSGALTRDPRYKPLEISELERTEIILTITTRPNPVSNIESIDVLRHGIALTCADGIATVYVPAEFRNSLPIQKQVKAKDCQISAFTAVTIK